MFVSTDWLSEYVDLTMTQDELTDRLTLTGLNLEGVETIGEDTAIDLEVTSNRPDCLGHIGVAREIAVLWEQTLRKPNPQPTASGPAISSLTSVTVDAPELCPRYTARLIKGVKIGPSPDWLANRLRSMGIAVINNVVDITNYVLMECGQPLHAFDFQKLQGCKLQVRRATAGEEFIAIDHKSYTLTGDEVVVADDQRPVALGGVMGGADTEVSDTTVDVLIESADFEPLTIRGAARRHVLFSPSSYRFERGVDPEGIEWASRRCCELILQLAGGELCEDMIDVAAPVEPRKFDNDRDDVKLRYSQIERLLGIAIPQETVRKILADLGCSETHACDKCVKTVPPTWRADLTREVDLIEEVARIYGYEKIPSNVNLGLRPSSKRREDVVLDLVRGVLTGVGFDEAFTLSAVEPELIELFRPWSGESTVELGALSTSTALLRGANCLRQSIVPSLLRCRRTNETLSNPIIELFEIAKIYLPLEGQLPDERRVLAISTGGGFLELKGVVEAIVAAVAPAASVTVAETTGMLLDDVRSCGLLLEGVPFCLMGELSSEGRDRFGLRGSSAVAEIDLAPLVKAAELVKTTKPLSSYPPVARDLNIVFDETIRWADVEAIAWSAGGELVERVVFQDDSYRDAKQLGEGKKSIVFRVELRSMTETLTSEQADAVAQQIIAATADQLGGSLRA